MKHISIRNMASCFFLAFCFFLAIPLSNGKNTSYDACSNLYSCGKIQNIGYPFWGGDRPRFCGMPDFRLTCNETNQYTTMNVFKFAYYVLRVLGIDASSHSMTVSPSVLFEHCYLQDTSRIALLPTLKPEASYTNISLSYGCANIDVSRYHSKSFNCSNDDGSKGLAYWFNESSHNSRIGKPFPCSNTVKFLVDKSALDELKSTKASLLNILKKVQIKTKYLVNFTACSKCEESGGRCGSSENLSEDKFVCYCRDGPHQSLVCPKSVKEKLGLILGLILGLGIGGALLVLIAILLFSSAWFCIYRRKHSKPSSDMEDIAGLESLQFEFKVIKAATDNFSPSNKLGQGGFGVVYKGKLQDEQEIAVKRLSIYSGQGISEFKTEILLAAKLQHNNLAKLLGFSLHGEEKLLIYELLPNASLDKVLFGQNKVSLDWETRYKILLGTARGLLYLHEDSRLKIIHRDLKSSNILLDETMNPKITDFGLARLVGRDQIHAETSKIAGTYGYMAPEYALTGRFSVMSDVYSFGIIALEIISGHMCSSVAFPYHEESLPLRAWNLWKSNSTLDLVDPRLYGKFPAHKMERCIYISLLCIQEDSNKRPTMTTIVSALNGHQVALSEPEPPLIGPSTNVTFGSHQHLGVSSSGEFLSNSDNITEVYSR